MKRKKEHNKDNKPKKNKKRTASALAGKAIREFILRVAVILMMLGGAGAIAYPFVYNALSERVDNEIVKRYQAKDNEVYRKEHERKLAEESAEEKSKKAALKDPFSEASLEQARFDAFHPNYYVRHTIGIIYIPDINVSLPIFDNTKEKFMAQGATWIPISDMIGSGVGHRTVVTGHRGLPTATLFTNLPKMAVDEDKGVGKGNGSIFILERDGKYYAYRAYKREIVKPEEIESIDAIPGKDTVSLLTCTPYMVNTHRLIITGERIPFEPSMLKSVNRIDDMKKFQDYALFAAVLAVIVGAIALIVTFWQTMRKKATRYDLMFKVTDTEGQPLLNAEYQLYNNKGKQPLNKNGVMITCETDAEGKVFFDDIPGIPVTVRQVGVPNGYKKIDLIYFNVKKAKDTNFTGKIKKRVLTKNFWKNKEGLLQIQNPKE